MKFLNVIGRKFVTAPLKGRILSVYFVIFVEPLKECFMFY